MLLKRKVSCRAGKEQESYYAEKEKLPVIQREAELLCKTVAALDRSAPCPKNAQAYWRTGGKLTLLSVSLFLEQSRR